jgi:hypothetical protein
MSYDLNTHLAKVMAITYYIKRIFFDSIRDLFYQEICAHDRIHTCADTFYRERGGDSSFAGDAQLR